MWIYKIWLGEVSRLRSDDVGLRNIWSESILSCSNLGHSWNEVLWLGNSGIFQWSEWSCQLLTTLRLIIRRLTILISLLLRILGNWRETLLWYCSSEKRLILVEHIVDFSLLSDDLTKISLNIIIFPFTKIDNLMDSFSELIKLQQTVSPFWLLWHSITLNRKAVTVGIWRLVIGLWSLRGIPIMLRCGTNQGRLPIDKIVVGLIRCHFMVKDKLYDK